MDERRGALAGLLAGGAALAVGELVAGIGGSRRAPVIAVGDLVIDNVPRPVKDLAIETFGTNDKVALLVGIYALIAVIAALLGIAATRRFATGAGGIAVFGAFGVLAALSGDDAGAAEVLAPVVGALAGIGTLRVLVGADPVPAIAAVDRRQFLVLALGAGAASLTVASIGRFLQGRGSAAASRLGVVLPRAAAPGPSIPASADLGIDGLSPFLTPNADFYRIDVNLIVPQVDAEGWRLRITGMVDREVELTYADVLATDLVEEDVTLACVSNEVGGGLVGNARWLGAPLLPLLERAGIDDRADQVVARSTDGFTVGFPVDALRDGRVALLAVGMNGEPLPIRHGFPARLVIAGLYGYVSATKWLSEIELTRFDAFDPYWIKRGWAVEAPIKTQSRIDTPRGRASGATIAVAGVAWAPTRGIAKVEVRVDDGDWEDCELSAEVGSDTWRQWLYRWQDAAPGRHRLTVRATDGDGETQPEARVEPFPDGATGWHSVSVTVE